MSSVATSVDGKSAKDAVSGSKFKSALDAVIDLISSLFLPIINLLVSAGILKGILSLVLASGVVLEGTSTYHILNAMSDALFYFIPLFLAYTSAKRFNVDIVTAMLIGTVIVYPSITTIMAGDAPVDLFGIVLPKATYVSSVLPIILAIYLTKWVELGCKKIIPETFVGLFTPPICIVVVIPVTLAVFGPIGTVLGAQLAQGYELVYSFAPVVAGILIGAVQPFLVMLGLHWALFPIALNNVAVYGFDTIMALFGGAIFAQGGAALAVALKARDKSIRSRAISASLTTLLGITEPAMYGVNLPMKRPMACACIAGGIGSGIAGFFNCAGTSFALPALTTLPVFMSRSFIAFVISLAAAFVIAFVLTLVTVKEADFENLHQQEQA